MLILNAFRFRMVTSVENQLHKDYGLL